MSNHFFNSYASDDDFHLPNRRRGLNEDDCDSDSTLCSDLENQIVALDLPHRRRSLGIQFIPNAFDFEGSDEFPPGLFGMGGLFGLGEGRGDFEDVDDEDEDELSEFSDPQYDDFNMQLGKLKLVPDKNHKYKIIPYFDCVYDFDAAEEFTILRAFGPPKHENLVPFRLDNASSFAEWYRYFKTSYSRTSPINQAYCTVDKRTFSSFFKYLDILPFEIQHVISAIEEAFSDTFKKCLGKNLQKIYANRNLSRELVEVMVVRELETKAKKGIIKNRHASLYERATTGDHGPYVKFLQAHEFPEEDIYDLVSTALVRNINDDKDLRYYDKMREQFRDWGGTPYDKLCNLVDFLREKDLIKPMEVPSYDVNEILKTKPEYKKFFKKGKRRDKKKKKSKEDICLRFHPEYGTVHVPLHSSKSCRNPDSMFSFF